MAGPARFFASRRGQNKPESKRWWIFLPDYKALYEQLFRETERARILLEQAQQDAEAAVLEDPPAPLRLAPPSRPAH